MSSVEIGSGFLLVAGPELADPNFARAVVLIISHDASGSFGLILNRPVQRRLKDVLPEVDDRAADVPLYQGGPVQTDRVQFISSGAKCGWEVAQGVRVGAGLEELLEASEPRIRAYAGYAGWGEGQLESETQQASWVIAPAHARHVFETPAERLWAEVLRELGGPYAWMSLGQPDPDQN